MTGKTTENPFRAAPDISQPVFRSALKAGLIASGIIAFFFAYFLTDYAMAVVFSPVVFICFYCLRSSALHKVYKQLKDNPPQFAGEHILMEGFATHHRYIEGECWGYLCLTEKRLHFKFYPFEEDEWGESILLSNIEKISVFNPFFVMAKGIRLNTVDGKTETFTVDQWRDGWLEEIYEAWKKVRPASHTALRPLPELDGHKVFGANGHIDQEGRLSLEISTDLAPGEVELEIKIKEVRRQKI